jgi:diphthamide synthase (EF-2-diphthine--ammonia ligase)
LLEELPEGVDPCGENGEFHTCVLGGPMFGEPLRAVVGEIVERDGFCFADLMLSPPMVDLQEAANNSMQLTALRAVHWGVSAAAGRARPAA